jgi:hypothetical protein
MRFDHSKSGLLAADWTRVMDAVLNPHVTSFRPFRVEGDATQMALINVGIEPGHLVMAARSNQECSVNVTVSRREMRNRLIAWLNTQIDFRYSIRSAFSCSLRLVWK